jgi:anti-anti-sigma factor
MNPPLIVTVDVNQDTIVVHCSGRLTIEAGNVLRTEVQKFIKPKAKIVLDLTSVTHCDSMGMGSVISLYVSSKSAGSRLEIINMSQTIRKLFSMANILSLFEGAVDPTSRIP